MRDLKNEDRCVEFSQVLIKGVSLCCMCATLKLNNAGLQLFLHLAARCELDAAVWMLFWPLIPGVFLKQMLHQQLLLLNSICWEYFHRMRQSPK